MTGVTEKLFMCPNVYVPSPAPNVSWTARAACAREVRTSQKEQGALMTCDDTVMYIADIRACMWACMHALIRC